MSSCNQEKRLFTRKTHVVWENFFGFWWFWEVVGLREKSRSHSPRTHVNLEVYLILTFNLEVYKESSGKPIILHHLIVGLIHKLRTGNTHLYTDLYTMNLKPHTVTHTRIVFFFCCSIVLSYASLVFQMAI